MAIEKTTYVLDTSALLYHPLRPSPHYRYVTTKTALEEVYKDPLRRTALEAQIEAGLLEIIDPMPRYLRKAYNTARKFREYRLSEADIEILAAAIELREKGVNVVVVTDDYALQNILSNLKMQFTEVRRRIKSTVKKWVYRCVQCGAEYHKPRRFCIYCGGGVERVPIET